MLDGNLLKNEERAVFALRKLYRDCGYLPYKMSRFEEYDLYLRSKEFLTSDQIITFPGRDGRLLALKPDVTLSIIKNAPDEPGVVQKVYYNETVYRQDKGTGDFKERMQTGLECVGDLSDDHIAQVVTLAAKSLETLGESFILNLSHMGLVNQVITASGLSDPGKALAFLRQKNRHELTAMCRSEGKDPQGLLALLDCDGGDWSALEAIQSPALAELRRLWDILNSQGYAGRVRLDFSVGNDMKYYNGVVFRGYLKGISESILTGGQYDPLLAQMGHPGRAIGFAIAVDLLERQESADAPRAEKSMLNIALPKGRLGEKVYKLLKEAGYGCPAMEEPGRKLIFENPERGVRYFWVKPSDVSIYVEHGAADVGIVGKDILLEYRPEVYELLDLKMGACHMAVAGPRDFREEPGRTLRVATKFPNIASRHYTGKCRDIDIIRLNGSIEIAPILGLSDVIVDIVETGATLKENDLVVLERIVPISARMVANMAAYQFHSRQIDAIRAALAWRTEDRT